jgi:hypothetical protein
VIVTSNCRTGPTFATLSIPNIPAPPLPQWTKEHDRMILTGVYKHGYGKFPEVQADDELPLGRIIANWLANDETLKQPGIPVFNKRLYKVLEAAKKHRVIVDREQKRERKREERKRQSERRGERG